MENNERRDLTISEDLHHILNVLKPKDAEDVLALKEELADIGKVAEQAKFELANSVRGQEGLKIFKEFCI